MAVPRALPSWVLDAARLPLRFAQVREDPEIDRWAVTTLDRDARVLMVASGGCTAAFLAALPRVCRLHLVDPSPAQLALSRLKLGLLERFPPEERLRRLGHAPMPAERRRRWLEEEGAQALGDLERLARDGPDLCGRYERVFAALRDALGFHEEVAALMALRDPREQARRVDPATPLGAAFDRAFETALDLGSLVALFGPDATRRPRVPFHRHFAERARWALSSLPAADNPYLAQVLLGRFQPPVYAPWLSAPSPARMPELVFSAATMAQALSGESGCDLVHLSNILDWADESEGAALLEAAWRALRPGSWVLLRQLNSTLDIPALSGRFEWLSGPAEALHAADRSFLYSGLYLGRKR